MSMAIPSLQPTSTSAAPTVSILMPVYNRTAFVGGALQSILAQTFTDYEVIVVDDGSTTDVGAAVKPYLCPQIRYVRLAENRKRPGAINAGLPLTQGRYIAFLDDDDRIPPDFLAEVVAALDAAPPTVGFLLPALHLVRYTPQGDVSLRRMTYGCTEQTLVSGAAYAQHPVGGGSGLVLTRRCYEAVGEFDPILCFGQDLDYMMRASAQFDFLILPTVEITLGHHADYQNTKPSLKLAAIQELLTDRYRDRFPAHLIRLRYRSAARMSFRLGDKTNGRRILRKLLRRYPFSPKAAALWMLYEIAHYLPQRVRTRLFRSARHG